MGTAMTSPDEPRTGAQRARARRTALILGLVAAALFAWTLYRGLG